MVRGIFDRIPGGFGPEVYGLALLGLAVFLAAGLALTAPSLAKARSSYPETDIEQVETRDIDEVVIAQLHHSVEWASYETLLHGRLKPEELGEEESRHAAADLAANGEALVLPQLKREAKGPNLSKRLEASLVVNPYLYFGRCPVQDIGRMPVQDFHVTVLSVITKMTSPLF